MRNIKKVFANGSFPSYCKVELKTSTGHKMINDEREDDEVNKTKEDEKAKEQNPVAVQDIKAQILTQEQLEAKKKNQSETEDQKKLMKTDKKKIVNGGITFFKTFRFELNVPVNKTVCPVMELFLYHYPQGRECLFGSGTFSMKEMLGWFYGDEDNDDYRRRWLNFFKISKGPKGEDDVTKPVKLKVPKVKAENQLLFLEDMIYELPTGNQYLSKKSQRKEAYKLLKEQKEKERLEQEKAKLADPGAVKQHFMQAFTGKKTTKPGEQPPLDAGHQQPDLLDKDHLGKLGSDGEQNELLDQPKTSSKHLKNEKLKKKLKILTEGLNPSDMDNLNEEEKIKIVEDLIRKKYIDDDSEDEEEEDEEEAKRRGETKKSVLASQLFGGNPMTPSPNPYGQPSILDPSSGPVRVGVSGNSGIDDSRMSGRDDLNKEPEQFNFDLEAKEDSEDNGSEKVIHQLEMRDDDDEIKSLKAEVSEKSLKYDELFVAPRAEAKREEIKAKAKKAAKKTSSLFSLKKGLDFFLGREKKIEYIDFDTNEDEDYSDVPEYLKGRNEFQEDLEDGLFRKKQKILQKFEIKRGNQRYNSKIPWESLGLEAGTTYDTVAEFKCIIVREDDKELVPIAKIRKFLTDQLKFRR